MHPSSTAMDRRVVDLFGIELPILRAPMASPLHRRALHTTKENETALTNVFTGRPARSIVNRLVREVGPLSVDAPPFPTASAAIAPLRARAEANDSADFTSLWCGQAARLAREEPAGALTKRLAREASW